MKGKKKCDEKKPSHESSNKAGSEAGTFLHPRTVSLLLSSGQTSPQESQNYSYLGTKFQLCPKPPPSPEHHLNPCVRALQML